MYVELEYVKFKNVLSYGAKEVEHRFEPGLTMISGRNGTGKSTLLEVLCYNWYGKPYRKIKLEALINRANRKGLETESGIIIDHKDRYRIIRGIKPATLKVFKNDVSFEMLSTKELNQDEITRILGIDYKMFKQIVSLAVTYNKPFLTLEAAEKREIVESIFNVKIFGAMLDALKKKVATEKVKYAVNKKTVEMLEENINIMRKNVIENKRANAEFETNRQKDLTDIDTDMVSTQALINRLNTQISTENCNVGNFKTRKDALAAIIAEKEEAFKKIAETANNETINALAAELKGIDDKIAVLQSEIDRLGREEIQYALDEKIIISLKTQTERETALTGKKSELELLEKTAIDYDADSKYTELKQRTTEITNRDMVQVQDSMIQIIDIITPAVFPITMQNKHNELVGQQKDSERTIKDENAYIAYLKDSTLCDRCKSPITDIFRAAETAKSKDKIGIEQLVLDKVNADIIAVDKKLADFNQLQTELRSLEKAAANIHQEMKDRMVVLDKERANRVSLLNIDIREIQNEIVKIVSAINNRTNEIRSEHDKKVAGLESDKSKLQIVRAAKENEITTVKEGAKTAAEQKLIKLKGDLWNNETTLAFSETNIRNLTSSLASSTAQYAKYEQSKKEIAERQPPFNLPAIEKDFKNKIDEFKTAYTENGAMADKLKIYDLSQNMLSEEGIKAFFLKRLTPILNAKINEYLDKFEIPVHVTFDSQMEEQIFNVGKENEIVSYFSYSEGEKKSIDIAILMSFIDITKIICNWNTNILLIDELIDAQVDFPRLEKIIECLKEFSGSRMIPSIYIISHRLMDDLSQYFKRVITTNKVNGFSEMTIRKI